VLEQSALAMARLIRERRISSRELVCAHIERIENINAELNAVVHLMKDAGLREAEERDAALARGEALGPLHGVPFSVKDSIDVRGVRTTAGTLGFRDAPAASRDATLVARLRAAGGIPICKTNLPDLLFSFETDNLLFGRTNNPYDVSKTSGGSSGGEAAVIGAGGSPLGLGSDCLGSVRVPAAFCGITSIKPTSGRLPRTGHVPPAGGWVEQLWQIGPMARWTEDLILAMQLLAGEDGIDLTSPPVPLVEAKAASPLCAAYFIDNGIARCSEPVAEAVKLAAGALEAAGVAVEEKRPPCIEQSYELEMSLLGADGGEGIAAYLADIGSREVHPQLTSFVERFRRFGGDAAKLAGYWSRWDTFRAEMARFFTSYDLVLSPVYPRTALEHGASMRNENFEGFSYTMTWSVAGFPAATVRFGESGGLPVNVQVVAKPWRDMTALYACELLERSGGGWKAPPAYSSCHGQKT
jgi:amidase